MNTKPYYPHQERKSTIKVVILLSLALIGAGLLFGCSPQKNGCRSVRGMSGYGKLHNKSNGWIKCLQTGTTAYFDKNGKLIHLCKR